MIDFYGLFQSVFRMQNVLKGQDTYFLLEATRAYPISILSVSLSQKQQRAGIPEQQPLLSSETNVTQLLHACSADLIIFRRLADY